ncbi:MAG: DNA primase [Desulfomonile sp.]|nr:DNA primase [Desulfomonile sp.]
MRISPSKIAEVAAAADIVQVISDYVDLKKAGKDYRGLCPFHGDSDPSFYVSPHKGIFYCFGCAAGGSVFNFLMKMENLTFAEAVRSLGRRYGIPVELERGAKRREDDRAKVLGALEAGHRYFRERLRTAEGPREYLSSRGLSSDWIERLELGFAPDSWDGALEYLRSAGVDYRDAAAAGLIKPRTAGGGYYDYFRSRIMIPIRDLSGNVCAFGGRVYGEGDPKYLNSPESSVFQKKRLLYGLDAARDAIRRDGFSILVEGYFDQIALRVRGMENAVAPLGTSLGREQVRLIKRFSSEVVTIFDGDEAGVRAVKRAIPVFLSEDMEPRCVILKEDKDPDDAVKRIGIDGFRRLVDEARPVLDVLLDLVVNQHDLGTLHGRNAAVEECLPVLGEIADSPARDYFFERCSSRLKVREEHLRRRLRTAPKSRPGEQRGERQVTRQLFDLPADERNVVRGMLLREGFIDRVIESGVVKDMEEPTLRLLAERMVALRIEAGGFDPYAFSRSLEDEQLAAMVASWLHPRREDDDIRPVVDPDVDGEAVLNHSVDSIRLRKIRRRKAEILERMKKCAPGEEEFVELARELQDIGRFLHA